MIIDVAKIDEDHPCPYPVEIIGYGHSVIQPGELVTNDEYLRRLPKHVRRRVYEDRRMNAEQTDDELHQAAIDKVVEVAGVHTRRVSPLNVVEMGTEAIAMAIKHAGLTPADIEFCYGAGNTGTGYPSLADHAKLALGFSTEVMGDDTEEACCSFIHVLHKGWAAIRSGSFKVGVVFAAEKATELTKVRKVYHHNLFGDDVGAWVLRRGEREHVRCFGFASNPFGGRIKYIERTKWGFDMVGPRVHRYVLATIPPRWKHIIEQTGVDLGAVPILACHQASARTLSELLQLLLPMWPETSQPLVLRNIETNGNTSSASIPAGISRAIHAGKIQRGQHAAMIAFGAGMSDAEVIVEL